MKTALFLGASSIVMAADLCLPPVHTTIISSWRDNIRVIDPDHRREYQEGDNLHLWIDQTQHKSLVHVHNMDPRYGPPANGVLTDYNTGLQWRWDWVNKTAQNCMLQKFPQPEAPICISQNANQTGSGTIGEDYHVDFYLMTIHDHVRGVDMDVYTTMQQNSLSKPVEQFSRGRHQNPPPDNSTDYWCIFLLCISLFISLLGSSTCNGSTSLPPPSNLACLRCPRAVPLSRLNKTLS